MRTRRDLSVLRVPGSSRVPVVTLKKSWTVDNHLFLLVCSSVFINGEQLGNSVQEVFWLRLCLKPRPPNNPHKISSCGHLCTFFVLYLHPLQPKTTSTSSPESDRVSLETSLLPRSLNREYLRSHRPESRKCDSYLQSPTSDGGSFPTLDLTPREKPTPVKDSSRNRLSVVVGIRDRHLPTHGFRNSLNTHHVIL